MAGDKTALVQFFDQMIPMHADSGMSLFQWPERTADTDIDITAFFGDIPGISGQVVFKKPEMTVMMMNIIREFFFDCGDQGIF